jgi:hypothetical protein
VEADNDPNMRHRNKRRRNADSLSSCHSVQKMHGQPMLDTMTIFGAWPLRTKVQGGRKLPMPPGVKAWSDTLGTELDLVECSLPKLLFGHNGKVLETQSQLAAALGKLDGILSQIAEVPGVEEWNPRRLDLVWNFDLPVRSLVLAHAALRVPGIQSGATLFPDGQGVSWLGAKSHFKVMLYDKARKMRVPGSVLRVEISLRGGQLARRIKGDWRNFDDLYRAYRAIMVSIAPITKPTAAANWPEAVGAEPLQIRERILARLAHKPSGTFRRYRRRIEAAAAKLPESFSWENVLPVSNPPPPVNVEPKRRRNLHDPAQIIRRPASPQTCPSGAIPAVQSAPATVGQGGLEQEALGKL